MARAWAGRDGTRMQMAGTRRLGRRGDLEREYQIGTSGACVLWLAISPGACGRGCRWGEGLSTRSEPGLLDESEMVVVGGEDERRAI